MHTDPEINGGLYIHIPFCRQKCPYCDFYSITDLRRIPSFLKAVEKEMQQLGSNLPVFDTLYVGGGTPSVLHAAEIEHVIETGFRRFAFRPDVEITVEVNPGTIDAEKLKSYFQVGVNRLNLGVQSFKNKNLAFLDRIHSAAESEQIIERSREAGFTNIGLDLIYGLPGQTPADWQEDLQRAVDFRPEHLSCYLLTCENGTRLSQDVKAGRTVLPSDAITRELFDLTIGFLKSNGYVQYEISNFARNTGDPAALPRSRHNQKYWSFAPYIGLGPSAHSFIGQKRRWNHRDLSAYLRDLDAGRLPVAGEETLTREQMFIEAIYLGFRTTPGIDLADFKARFGIDFLKFFDATVAGFKKEGWLKITGTHCALTVQGMAFLDSIAAAFTNQEMP